MGRRGVACREEQWKRNLTGVGRDGNYEQLVDDKVKDKNSESDMNGGVEKIGSIETTRRTIE